MAMETESPESAGEQLQAGPTDAEQEEPQRNTVHLSPDMLPEGMAGKMKEGVKLMFCCTGDADAEGDTPGYFEKAGGGEDEGNYEESYADGFRKEMSPQAGGETEEV